MYAFPHQQTPFNVIPVTTSSYPYNKVYGDNFYSPSTQIAGTPFGYSNPYIDYTGVNEFGPYSNNWGKVTPWAQPVAKQLPWNHIPMNTPFYGYGNTVPMQRSFDPVGLNFDAWKFPNHSWSKPWDLQPVDMVNYDWERKKMLNSDAWMTPWMPSLSPEYKDTFAVNPYGVPTEYKNFSQVGLPTLYGSTPQMTSHYPSVMNKQLDPALWGWNQLSKPFIPRSPSGYPSLDIEGSIPQTGMPLSNVRYIDNDTETIIDCFLPGINTETSEVVAIGGEIRIRPMTAEVASMFPISGFYSLPLPQLGDGTRIKAQALNDFLRITVPTAANVASTIQKVRPAKIG